MFLVLILLFSCIPFATGADAAVNEDMVLIANEDLAEGIRYTEEDIQNYAGTTGYRVRFNHLAVNPGAQGIRIIAGKAKGAVNAVETVGSQAQREISMGNQVVAGINADSYDMDYGSNRGIMVQNGDIITSQPYNSYTETQPAFWVDSSQKAHIGALRTGGTIRIGSSYQAEADLINRNHFMGPAGYLSPANSTRIFTSNLTTDRVMANGAGKAPADQAYALIQIAGFSGFLHVGTEYSGKVTALYSSAGFSIPSDCIVYAGYGTKAAEVRGLATGMDVSYVCHLYSGSYTENPDGTLDNRGTLQDDAVTAVNSFQLLAKNGELNHSVVDATGTDQNARTVIGLTKDGTIHVLAVAKAGAYFSASRGSAMKDAAEYMLQKLQCTDVINMDGGGSTEMIARRAGSDKLTTVSYPSDGSSRIVSNSLLFVSDARPAGVVGQVLVDRNTSLYKGSRTSFSVRLTDRYGNPIPAQGHSVVWKAEKGAIDQNGNYTAPGGACQDTVTAAVDGVSGTADVRVVDLGGMNSIGLRETGAAAVQKGARKQFALQACDSENQMVLIDPSAVKWSLSNSKIGTIENGLLSVTAAGGTAAVSASFGGKTYSIPVVVGPKGQTIDNFEQFPIEGYYAGSVLYGSKNQYGGKSGMLGLETKSMPNSRVRDGSRSLRLTYDTSLWAWDDSNQKRTSNGTASLIPLWDTGKDYAGGGKWNEKERAAMESNFTAKAMPKNFGVWVYSGDGNHDGVSDNKNCMLSVSLYADCAGGYRNENKAQPKTLLLTDSMNWIGWKYLQADIPQDWRMPIVFNYLSLSNKERILKPSQNYKTDLLFDDLQFNYAD
ncbi:phosphodiester glycosidase family protein [Caproiciproducens sp. NJN-50]|uniref:phosphodiester glycosidase family protein n=1 Tax=Acutalibacteraceae TaxID=3082771 RepID=UPI000FFE2146|nr:MULTISPECIES: phosphodiester glycosidase family protein [Acutalibacteraceae]QAT49975.1 phosphodiester glycosidase family protein [Caproiciproducens sp. NJN-50]